VCKARGRGQVDGEEKELTLSKGYRDRSKEKKMLPKLADLKRKCEKLGLKVIQSGKREAKKDFVLALKNHHLPPGGLPYEEVEPMLCFAEWNLKESEREHMWISPNWIAQEKLNGVRLIVHFVKDVGWFAHTRNVSVKTWRFDELHTQFLWKDWIPPFSATLDCEVMIMKAVDTREFTAKGQITETTLHSTTSALSLEARNSRKMQKEQDAPLVLLPFDILSCESKELKHEPLEERLRYLRHFETMLRVQMGASLVERFFSFPGVESQLKKEFFKDVVAKGGEGVVMKNLRSPYIASSSRRRDGWVKVKKRIEVDAYVTGFKRGEPDTEWANMVGAIEFSVMTEQGEHPIGFGINLTMEQRRKVTRYDSETDEVKLHPGMYGKVAEISGQDISARVLRLTHCTIDRWRNKRGDEKGKEDCVVKLADLREMARWQ